jgi:hypothetical protein
MERKISKNKEIQEIQYCNTIIVKKLFFGVGKRAAKKKGGRGREKKLAFRPMAVAGRRGVDFFGVTQFYRSIRVDRRTFL